MKRCNPRRARRLHRSAARADGALGGRRGGWYGRPTKGGALASPPTAPRPPMRARRCHVLDELPGVAADLAPATRALARRSATAAVALLSPGVQPLQDWWPTTLHGPGLLVLHGVIARETHVAGRTATELLGSGDLLRPWDHEVEPMPYAVAYRVLEAADVALLDAFFADRVRPWPAILGEVTACAVQRAESLALQRAIASHPRVDMRVSMLLWHLATRWGKVVPDGSVRLELPLTHRLLGELVGAERPSVSHAVGRLTKAGLVRRDGGTWYLTGTAADHAAVAQRPLAEQLAAAAR